MSKFKNEMTHSSLEDYLHEYHHDYREWIDARMTEAKEGFEQTNRIFVYGTLQSGCSNNQLLTDSELLGNAETEELYYMSVSGSIPFVHKDIQSTNIKGEVWEVKNIDAFQRIDSLESHPEWYRREIINVNLKGKIVKAWIYFNNDTFHKYCIADGDYKNYIRARY